MNLSDYLSSERGRARALAKSVGVSQSLVAQWARGKPVSAIRCPAIEAATAGEVSRADLRPDDWSLIWPELASSSAANAAVRA